MLPCLTSGVMDLPPAPMPSAQATGFSGRGFGLPWITALPSDAVSSPRCPRMPGVTAPCSPFSPDRACPGVLSVASAGRAQGGPCAALGAAAMLGGDTVVSSGGPWSRHVDGCSAQCQAQRLTVLGFFSPILFLSQGPSLQPGVSVGASTRGGGSFALGPAFGWSGSWRRCRYLPGQVLLRAGRRRGQRAVPRGRKTLGRSQLGVGGNIWGKTLPSHGPDLLGTGGGSWRCRHGCAMAGGEQWPLRSPGALGSPECWGSPSLRAGR